MDDMELDILILAAFLALPALLAPPDPVGKLVGFGFLAISMLIPQGRLLLKAGEYTGARRRRFLLLNEGMLAALAALTVLVWWLEVLFGVRDGVF